MTELNDKILKAIQEDLPQATAGELKKFIEEANATKQQLEINRKVLEDLQSQNAKYKADEATYATALALRNEAETKLKNAVEKENLLQFTIQQEKIVQREFVINKFEGFLNNLVKNPRAVELISETKNVPVWESYAGGGGYHTTKQETTVGHVEKQETKD